ncbi:MAG: hypothetical protein HZA27_04990 [Candidatus Omnitrophica bacterium]|nr:hypothetical protein [Candidatus Omnitrophota bacterium]
MVILVRIIGWVVVVAGLVFVVNPDELKKYVSFCSKGERPHLMGITRLCLGVILLAASSECRWPVIVWSFGVLSLVKSLLIFALGIDKVRAILNWWGKRPSDVIRLLGAIALALGVLLIYSA